MGAIRRIGHAVAVICVLFHARVGSVSPPSRASSDGIGLRRGMTVGASTMIMRRHLGIIPLRGGDLESIYGHRHGGEGPLLAEQEDWSRSSGEDTESSTNDMFKGAEEIEAEYEGEIIEGPEEDAGIEIEEGMGEVKAAGAFGMKGPKTTGAAKGNGTVSSSQDVGGGGGEGGGGGKREDVESSTDSRIPYNIEEDSEVEQIDMSPGFLQPGEVSRNLFDGEQHPAGYAINIVKLEVRKAAGEGVIVGDTFPVIAVSHGQPLSSVLGVWRQRDVHFGELRDEDLVARSKAVPPDARWHLLGPIPLYNASRMEALCDVPNLESVMSLRSVEEAMELDEQCRAAGRMERLDVWVLVCTGVGAPGVRIDACVEIVEFIETACPRLRLSGITGVTGGVGGGEASSDALPALLHSRKALAQAKGINPERIRVIAGQTNNYRECVRHGVCGICVGEGIFGKRTVGSFNWETGENEANVPPKMNHQGPVSENVPLPGQDWLR